MDEVAGEAEGTGGHGGPLPTAARPPVAPVPGAGQLSRPIEEPVLTNGGHAPASVEPSARADTNDAIIEEGAGGGAAGGAGAGAEVGSEISAAVAAACDEIGIPTGAPACLAYARRLDNLRTGVGAFNAPPSMVRGSKAQVKLVIGEAGDVAAVREGVAGLGGSTTEFTTRVYASLGAELIGSPGLDVEPTGIIRKPLAPTGPTDWIWTVTAREGGRQMLTLKPYVYLRTPDGKLSEHPIAARAPLEIDVRVTTGQRLRDGLQQAGTWLGDLENLAKALAALVVAVGGLWFAIRTFGRSAT